MKTNTAPAVTPHIRWMIARDLDKVVAIERASFDHPWTMKNFRWCAAQRNIARIVAEVGDAIAGYAVYQLAGGTIDILNLAVGAEHRRRGVARALVGKLVEKLAAHDRRRITATVRETNLAAQLFFRACGFRAVAVVRGLYDYTAEDAYRMAYRRRAGGGL